MGTKRTFTEGKIFSPLISFAFPVLIALFLQAMYGAVDLWVVGNLVPRQMCPQWLPEAR